MIDIRTITEQLIKELLHHAEVGKIRAEGVKLLYERIRQEAERGEIPDSQPSEQEAGPQESV